MSEIDLLRYAATLMRARAQAATPGPWKPGAMVITDPDGVTECAYAGAELDNGGEPTFALAPELLPTDAEHIASWHPLVALAVADWLDVVADYGPPREGYGTRNYAAALAVARTFLGDTDE